MGPRIKHRKPCLKKGAWWSTRYVMLWAQRSKSSELGGYCLRWSMAILDPAHWPLWPSCFRASQVVLVVKDPLASLGDVRDAGSIPGSGRCKRCGFDPWVGKIPWRRAWQSTPVLFPGESHVQSSLAGYGP